MNSPATLTAIAYAARQTGDRDLQREAIARLKSEYGITLSFTRPDARTQQQPQEARAHA